MNSFDSEIAVAVPWGLTHYMPLNGFHPLYKALFEGKPKNISINVWDNMELSNTLRVNLPLRSLLLGEFEKERTFFEKSACDKTQSERLDGFWYPNSALTRLLEGDIEFHHTAPYPSMTRPFVFHCESFAPIFFPFAHQGTGNFLNDANLKQYYKAMFESELCLGIFSHLQETLDDISIFFDSKIISEKLFLSRIGLSDAIESASVEQNIESEILEPRFLFVNSANQNPSNFFHRGGHIVLRSLKALSDAGKDFKAYMRCARPSDELLVEYGVELSFLKEYNGTKIIWIEGYLSEPEINNLMYSVDFMLLPSSSLHSVSIMQAMRCGAVPIVTDTIGTSLYVDDGHDGVMLRGVLSANWQKDEKSGIMYDSYHKNDAKDAELIKQMTVKILELLSDSSLYSKIRSNAIQTATTKFSGNKFASDFWETVSKLVAKVEVDTKAEYSKMQTLLEACYASDDIMIGFFESPTQPLVKIFTGDSLVVEMGDYFIHMLGYPQMELHHWSVVSEYVNGSISLTFARRMSDLKGLLMVDISAAKAYERSFLIQKISKKLDKFPRLKKPIKALYKKLLKPYLVKKTDSSESVKDIELCVEGFCGYNLIRCEGKYYAILQHEGAFSLGKIKYAAYSSFFVGNSVEALMANIDQELVAENVSGFNIVRCLDRYYGILQHEGTLELDKLNKGGYSIFFLGLSRKEVENKIQKYVERS